MTAATTASTVAMDPSADSQRASVKRKAEDALDDPAGLTDQEALETSKKVKLFKPATAETSAPRERSYMVFKKADTVFAAQSADRIEELRSVLEKEGLSPHLKFKIAGGTLPEISFQHSRTELSALSRKHPVLVSYLKGLEGASCLFQDAVKYQKPSEKGLCESVAAIMELMRTLVEESARHYQSKTAPSPVGFTFQTTASDADNLKAAFQKFPGVCVGEVHPSVSPKRFLIDNMEALRDVGVKTLFMEDFFYDTQQPLLDQYFDTPDAEMPLLLQIYLREWSAHYEFQSPYTYEDIVRKAKQCGIRIVGIDTSTAAEAVPYADSEQEDPMKRLRAMNFVAEQIIEREKGNGKYLAFMGQGHAATIVQLHKDEPKRVAFSSTGMADLLQCPLISIGDTSDGQETPPSVNCISFTDMKGGVRWYGRGVHLLLLRAREVNL